MILPKKHYYIIISTTLTIVAITFLVMYINRTNDDMIAYNLVWHNALSDQGIAKALATDFLNYIPTAFDLQRYSCFKSFQIVSGRTPS